MNPLDEMAAVLTEQDANPYRTQAYRRAAESVRRCAGSVAELAAGQGIEGLIRLPGVGLGLARSIHLLAHDGRLASVIGLGPKRIAGIRDALAGRLGRLRRIAPRRFNPNREAWLLVLHTRRGERHYTALFSNTARAHEMGRTHDWVVIFFDADSRERQCAVVTALRGPLAGKRVVRGRKRECENWYGGGRVPPRVPRTRAGGQPSQGSARG